MVNSAVLFLYNIERISVRRNEIVIVFSSIYIMTMKNDNRKHFISALTKQQIKLYSIKNRTRTKQQVNAVETIQNNSICRYRRLPKIK